MTLLWAVPPVAVAAGAVLVLLHLRGITDALVALRLELARLGEVRDAVDEVRSLARSRRR